MYFDRTLLGQSKSGSVFRSVHPQTGQTILLKIMPWDGSAPCPLDTELVVSMAPKIMQVGRGSGFNIARLLAVDQLDEGLAVASEYFQAPTVTNHPEKGTMTAERAVDVANQLINGLYDGERVRMIHGDVKPSNVLIGSQQDGRPHVKLTDFALNHTRSVHPIETLLFTAPERLDGSAPSLRGDLFSVGSVLYFLLTGTPLVRGRNAIEISNAWKSADPEQIKKLRKDLPSKFTKFLLGLLELRPDKRPLNPSSARNLLAECSPPPLIQVAVPVGMPSIRQSAAPPTAAIPVVPVQGPMRPPTTGINIGGQTPGTSSVPVVALRPPPEIAAKLNIPVAPPPIVPAPPPIAVQPPPPPLRQQEAPVYQAYPPVATAPVRQLSQQPRSKSPIFLILTVLVILSMIGCVIYVYMRRENLTKREEAPPPKPSSKDLRELMRKGG